MTEDRVYWEHALKKSRAEFSSEQKVHDCKERMYNNIMGKIAKSGQPIPSFEQSEQIVSNMEKRDQKKKQSATVTKLFNKSKASTPNKNVTKYIKIFSGTAVAAALIFVVTGLNRADKPAVMAQQYFNPPITQEDIPTELINSDEDIRSLAVNNNFALAYEKNDDTNTNVNLVVVSRYSKINYKQLFVTDGDNNLITPILVDEKNNKVVLPVCDSDLTLEVSDEDGNNFQCIVPKKL